MATRSKQIERIVRDLRGAAESLRDEVKRATEPKSLYTSICFETVKSVRCIIDAMNHIQLPGDKALRMGLWPRLEPVDGQICPGRLPDVLALTAWRQIILPFLKQCPDVHKRRGGGSGYWFERRGVKNKSGDVIIPADGSFITPADEDMVDVLEHYRGLAKDRADGFEAFSDLIEDASGQTLPNEDTGDNRKRNTVEHANREILDLLLKLCKVLDPRKITAKRLAGEIGCSTGLIAKCPAWKKFVERRACAKSSGRTEQLTDIDLDNRASDELTPDEIAMERERIISEHNKDKHNQDSRGPHPNKQYPGR